MNEASLYVVTWWDSDGLELAGWYRGTREQAQRWARDKREALGAIGVSVEVSDHQAPGFWKGDAR